MSLTRYHTADGTPHPFAYRTVLVPIMIPVDLIGWIMATTGWGEQTVLKAIRSTLASVAECGLLDHGFVLDSYGEGEFALQLQSCDQLESESLVWERDGEPVIISEDSRSGPFARSIK